MHKSKIILILLLVIFCSGAHAQKRNQKKNIMTTGISHLQKPEVSALFLDATKAKLLGNKDKAIMLYNSVLEKDPGNDAACYELAQLYFDRNDVTTALQLAEKAVTLDDSNLWYKNLLIQLYKHSDKPQEALNLLQTMLKSSPDNMDYQYEIAEIYMNSNKFKEAIETYNKIENKLGVSEDLSLQKLKIFQQQKDYKKYTDEIKKLAEAFPENKSRYYAMTAEMFMSGKLEDKAYEYYQKIVENNPSDPYVHISLSDYYRQKGDKQKAIDELNLGFANPDLDIDTKIRVMLAYYSSTDLLSGKKEEALKLVQTLAKTHPDDPKAHSILGDFYAQANQYNEARNEYLWVLAVDSSKYAVWEGLMQCQMGLSDYNGLIQTSKRVSEFFPQMPVPYLYKGMALYQVKQFDDALKSLNTGVKLVAGNNALLAQFYGTLGDTYNELKQYESSYQNYDKALSIDPKNSYVLNNYAYYLSVRGIQLDKAEEMAKKAIELSPENSANLDTYGWVLYKMQKYTEAKEYIQKAISLNPKADADVLEHMGDVMFKLGDVDKAVEYWKQALSAGGGSQNLQKKVKDKKLYE
jgi:tetratricopeptide (TPR) repeat protein